VNDLTIDGKGTCGGEKGEQQRREKTRQKRRKKKTEKDGGREYRGEDT